MPKAVCLTCQKCFGDDVAALMTHTCTVACVSCEMLVPLKHTEEESHLQLCETCYDIVKEELGKYSGKCG